MDAAKFWHDLRRGDELVVDDRWPTSRNRGKPLIVREIGTERGVPTIWFEDGTNTSVPDPTVPILLKRRP